MTLRPRFLAAIWPLFFLMVFPADAVNAQSSRLDPLSMQEHWTVLEVLSDAGRLDDATRFNRVALAPPDKSLAWTGKTAKRIAEVIIKQGRAAIKAHVDLQNRKLLDWETVPGAHAAWLMEEYIGATVAKVKADARFQQALQARGFTRPDFIQCRVSPPGAFGEPEYRDVRLGVVRCFPAGPHHNKYPSRVEGLLILADMDSGEILKIDDYEIVPAVNTVADYADLHKTAQRNFSTPLVTEQSQGPAFSLDGNWLTWDRWKFHLQSDQRVGVVISEVQWLDKKGFDKNQRDKEHWRPVLYQGHLSEISVPYMAPHGDWYLRNPIDAGEYSAGGLSDPLIAGVHCPRRAHFFNSLIVNDRGYPQTKDNVICVFERATDKPLWVHDQDGRLNRQLVVRMSARLGNYDYLIDWYFNADGEIRIALGATGIVSIMNTRAKNADEKNQQNDAYGRFVDDHVVAINHSHFFNFKLDLDVDGRKNNFHRGDLVQKRLPTDHPRRSLWIFDDKVLGNENEGLLDAGHGALWRMASADKTNAHGYPTSYQIMPGMSSPTLLSDDDYARTRAGFTDHQLWLTAQHNHERFAAGEFPTLSEPGLGLPAWSNSETIHATDIVAWYTIGMHHVVRAEDWPVMPVLWHDVTLRPFDFFDRNAALTLPPTTK